MKASLEAVKDVYKRPPCKGIGCGIKSTGLGNGTIEGGYITIRVVDGPRLEILNGYTEMGQGVFTATMQAVCEETGLPADLMTVQWDRSSGTNAARPGRRGHRSVAPLQVMPQEVGGGSEEVLLKPAYARNSRVSLRRTRDDRLKHVVSGFSRTLRGRSRRSSAANTTASMSCAFTTRPGTPEAVLNPTTHLTFSYATQVVILNDEGVIERVVAAHDVGRAINPRLCAEQMEGGVHMGLGYALSEDFPSTKGVPHSLALRDLGIVAAKHMPAVDVILIEVPDEIGGYGAKGVGEIGCVATAPAVAAALHAYDGVRRFRLPMDDAPAARPSVPKSAANLSAALSRRLPMRGPAAGRQVGFPDPAPDMGSPIAGPCRG